MTKVLSVGVDGNFIEIDITGGNIESVSVKNTTLSTIAAGKLVDIWLDGTDLAIRLADLGTTNTFMCRGITLTSIGAGASDVVLKRGKVTGLLTGLTVGGEYFVDPATPGGYTATVPNTTNQKIQNVFFAEAANIIDFNPNKFYIKRA